MALGGFSDSVFLVGINIADLTASNVIFKVVKRAISVELWRQLFCSVGRVNMEDSF